jgi:hypothetical protein
MIPAHGRAGGSRPRALLLLALACAPACLNGCATYATGAKQVRGKVATGDLAGALELLKERGGKDPDVLNLLERGLLLHYDGQFEPSNQALQLAEQKIDDLYTKSVSRGVAAFLTNDGKLAYSGYPHEQVLLHLYGALNYLALDETDDALVECRRVGQRLQVLEDLRANKKGYTDDACVEWIAGMLYAQDGDGNAALVAARRAQAAYGEYDSLWGIPAPPQLLADHARWARAFGFGDEAAELTAKGGVDSLEALPLCSGEGELLLVYESGFVAHFEEQQLQFPILKTDRDKSSDQLFSSVATRGHRGALLIDLDTVELDYWLVVAMPELVQTPSRLVGARLRVGERASETVLAEDVSAVARLTFEEGQGTRLLKTIARAIAKYALTKQAKKQGEAAGFLANVFAAATERADTRSWTLLPDRIHLARMRLPAGVHSVVVEVLDGDGAVAQTATFQRVEIRAGETTVITHRTYD